MTKQTAKGTGKFDAMGGEIPQEIIDALNSAEQAKVSADTSDTQHEAAVKASQDAAANEQTLLAASVQAHKDATDKATTALNLIRQRYGL